MQLIKFKDQNRYGSKVDAYMLRVSTKEATAIIASMAQQMTHGDPNTDRLESYTIGSR